MNNRISEWLPKYYCNYCQEYITDVRIKCAECQDFDLCLQCFSSGAEVGNHKSNHKYQLIDSCSFSIFKSNDVWRAREELILLDSVEHFGYGNWEDPVKALDDQKSLKSLDGVRQHFEDYYIQGNIGKLTWNKEPLFIAHDHTSTSTGPLSPSLASRLTPSTETNEFLKVELGYMPKRDDFEREFDNDAELLVSNLVLCNDDEDIDNALKLAQIDMYVRVQKERQNRKTVVRNHNLVNQYFNSLNKQKTPNCKKKYSKDEKELLDRFQPFAQFQCESDRDTYISNLKREKELKARIKELARCRRNGITKLKECFEYETNRYKREKRKENHRKKSGNTMVSPRKLSTVTRRLDGGKNPDTSPEEKSAENDSVGTGRKVDGSVVSVDFNHYNKLLSSREKKLCSSLGLKPSYYLRFKTILLKDQHQIKKGNLSKFPTPIGLAKSHRTKMLSFFKQSGWITAV